MADVITKRWLQTMTVIAVIVVGNWGLQESEFCVIQMRYLSDRELIESALRNHHGIKDFDGSEEAVQQFLENNPQCCAVDRHRHVSWSNDAVRLFFGYQYSDVEINFEEKSINASTPRYEKQYLPVSACGRVHNDLLRTSTVTLEKASPFSH